MASLTQTYSTRAHRPAMAGYRGRLVECALPAIAIAVGLVLLIGPLMSSAVRSVTASDVRLQRRLYLRANLEPGHPALCRQELEGRRRGCSSGRINIGDGSKSETYLSTYVGLRTVLDVEYFKEIAKLKPSFLVRSEQIVARVVSGEDQMAFFGMPTRAYQANLRGAKVEFLLPQEGVVLLPQATFIIKGAPHPSAARLWIDFILSEAGQEILVRNEALISGRTGFNSPIPKYAPSIDALHLIKIDWRTVSSADMKKARDEWSIIFNP